MLKIALLDDDKPALVLSKGAIEGFFQEKNIEFSIDAFTSPLIFLDMAKEEKYDLIFLDIDMPDVNGIYVGEQVREFDSHATLIYLSQREDLVFETLPLHPFGFIRKSRILQDFSNVLNLYVNTALDTDASKSSIVISSKSGVTNIDVNKVMYIEGNKNYQTFYLTDKTTVDARVLMNELEEKLAPKGFIRVHKGYLVNYLFIRKIENTVVVLTDNSMLPIAGKRKGEIMEQYLAISRKNKSIHF